MVHGTGCDKLDELLGGGLPEQRAVQVLGGPGTGKSTLAMQFLQEGVENGEECLFISTEQTIDELQSSFGSFEFDFHHENLAVRSIHATPARTMEEGEGALAIGSLDEGERTVGAFPYPFEPRYITEYIEELGPCDRVVFDSISGLSALGGDPSLRPVVLDLIRLFSDEFEATSILTSEEPSSGESAGLSNVLQYTAHGVIELGWQRLHGSRRRYLQVQKMRGVDHDTRTYEVGFDEGGIYLSPSGRASGHAGDETAVIPSGIEGFDDVGGGLVRGHSVLLEYDGRAAVDDLVVGIAEAALDAGMAIWLITSPVMSAERVQSRLSGDWKVDRLLDEDRLFVLDGFSAFRTHHDHRNVFAAPTGLGGAAFRWNSTISIYLMKRIARKVGQRRDRPLLGTVYTEAFLRWLAPREVKEVYYWARQVLAQEYDTGFFIHNPETMQNELAEFFHSDALQVFETFMSETGIQYLTVRKSPIGQPGQASVVDFSGPGPVVESRPAESDFLPRGTGDGPSSDGQQAPGRPLRDGGPE